MQADVFNPGLYKVTRKENNYLIPFQSNLRLPRSPSQPMFPPCSKRRKLMIYKNLSLQTSCSTNFY